jgi:short-subunit dehydrogenase
VALPPPSDSSTALVTGASSGIGAEIARRLAARGHGMTLTARRLERLQELAEELSSEHGVRVESIAGDISEQAERDRVADEIEALGLTVEVLVNNAGHGDAGDTHRTDRSRLLSMVRLNCEALLDFHARYTAEMAERGRGAVINVASTAAFQPIPGTGTYAATKAFVLSLSESSHAELSGSGVTVTALCPGPVKTEFMETAGVGAAEQQVPGVFWTDVEDVAREAVEGADKGKRVVVPGLLNRAGALSGQHSPRMLVLPLAKRIWRRAM